MFARKLITAAALIAFTAGSAFAQAAAPAAPKPPAAPVPAVVAPPKPAAAAPAAPAPVAAPAKPAVAPAAVAAKTNLNTASADDLDKLPQIGPARSKAIIEARTKAKFKDWADFTGRNVVPSNAEAAIKDLVSF